MFEVIKALAIKPTLRHVFYKSRMAQEKASTSLKI